jgi:hypothetical protein
MEKIMPLELLASIRGAASSEDVEALFGIIKKAVSEGKLPEGSSEADAGGSIDQAQAGASADGASGGYTVSPDALREDVVAHAPSGVKELIRKNFPGEKGGYLVVPRVIED